MLLRLPLAAELGLELELGLEVAQPLEAHSPSGLERPPSAPATKPRDVLHTGVVAGASSASWAPARVTR